MPENKPEDEDRIPVKYGPMIMWLLVALLIALCSGWVLLVGWRGIVGQ